MELVRDVSGKIEVFGLPAHTLTARAEVGLSFVEQENDLDGSATKTLILHGTVRVLTRRGARPRQCAG